MTCDSGKPPSFGFDDIHVATDKNEEKVSDNEIRDTQIRMSLTFVQVRSQSTTIVKEL